MPARIADRPPRPPRNSAQQQPPRNTLLNRLVSPTVFRPGTGGSDQPIPNAFSQPVLSAHTSNADAPRKQRRSGIGTVIPRGIAKSRSTRSGRHPKNDRAPIHTASIRGLRETRLTNCVTQSVEGPEQSKNQLPAQELSSSLGGSSSHAMAPPQLQPTDAPLPTAAASKSLMDEESMVGSLQDEVEIPPGKEFVIVVHMKDNGLLKIRIGCSAIQSARNASESRLVLANRPSEFATAIAISVQNITAQPENIFNEPLSGNTPVHVDAPASHPLEHAVMSTTEDTTFPLPPTRQSRILPEDPVSNAVDKTAPKSFPQTSASPPCSENSEHTTTDVIYDVTSGRNRPTSQGSMTPAPAPPPSPQSEPTSTPIPPRRGEIVDVWWEDREKWFRGRVRRRGVNGKQSEAKHEVQIAYEDGDILFSDLNETRWRIVDRVTSEHGRWIEPGELTGSTEEETVSHSTQMGRAARLEARNRRISIVSGGRGVRKARRELRNIRRVTVSGSSSTSNESDYTRKRPHLSNK